MESERKSRLVKEGRFLQQLESHATYFEKKWLMERQERVDGICQLQQALQTRQEERLEQQTAWQTRIDAELQTLQQDLEMEMQQRQQQENDTIAALNQVTQQLQSSLAILNGE